ncbi:MAG: hypothetical protein ACR2QC_04195 [Gammaproteobacteria bacterium]
MNTITSILTDLESYQKVLNGLQECSETDRRSHLRNLCLTDLYFLIRYGCGRQDIERPWLFKRCRQVQSDPDGYIDLWAREHYKSTIITFGLTVQDILNDPELTFGIFSHTRPIAKGFLRQIKRELEGNEMLKSLFPDVLWKSPQKDAPKWSEDDGLIVRRKTNPKESTIEAWGIVDGQPTSKHFSKMVYDDVVTKESVTTPDMIRKVTEAWELSTNLGSEGGVERYIGTRYHYNDTYREIVARQAARPRVFPATRDGTVHGEPVLLSREALAEKRRKQGPYTFACQMLQDPKADETQGFLEPWLRFYDGLLSNTGLNIYITVDAASEKKKDSDYTAAFVIGLGGDKNYYILDMVRDRLSLTQRADLVFNLHRKWVPRNAQITVGYEKYGLMADIEHMQDRQARENYRFPVVDLGGQQPKHDRIRRLIPIFEQGRVWLPRTHIKTNYEGTTVNLTETFIEEEYKPFPVSLHDDMLDALSRIFDMATIWPAHKPEGYEPRFERTFHEEVARHRNRRPNSEVVI